MEKQKTINKLRRKPTIPEGFEVQKAYEVRVDSVGKSIMNIIRTDLIDPTHPTDTGILECNRIPQEYRSQIHSGSIFYWAIGRYQNQTTSAPQEVFDFNYGKLAPMMELHEQGREARAGMRISRLKLI